MRFRSVLDPQPDTGLNIQIERSSRGITAIPHSPYVFVFFVFFGTVFPFIQVILAGPGYFNACVSNTVTYETTSIIKENKYKTN